MSADRAFENKWTVRRRAILATLAGTGGSMAYILFCGVDNALNRDAFTTLAFLFGSTLFGYLGWATYDDKSVVDRLGKDAFKPRREVVPEGYPSDIAPPEGFAE